MAFSKGNDCQVEFVEIIVRLSLSKPDIIKVHSFFICLRQAQADTPYLMEYYWKASLTKRHWIIIRLIPSK